MRGQGPTRGRGLTSRLRTIAAVKINELREDLEDVVDDFSAARDSHRDARDSGSSKPAPRKPRRDRDHNEPPTFDEDQWYANVEDPGTK